MYTPGGYRTKIIRHPDGSRQVDLIYRDRDLNIITREKDPNDTYDPRVRPWYKKAKRDDDIVWTDPYVFFTSQKPGITIAGPVHLSDNSLKGVVGVDIRIDQLSTFIAKLRIGKNGKAFLLNRNMDVVAFPDLAKITRANRLSPGKTRLVKINEIDDTLSRKAFDAVNWKKDAGGQLIINAPHFAEFENAGNGNGETNSKGGELMPAPFIELIAGNVTSENESNNGQKYIQGVGRGENIVDCLEDLTDLMNDFLGAMINFCYLQIVFNTAVQVNILPFHSFHSATGTTINQQLLTSVFNALHHIRTQLNSTFPTDYLKVSGNKYIASKTVFAT